MRRVLAKMPTASYLITVCLSTQSIVDHQFKPFLALINLLPGQDRQKKLLESDSGHFSMIKYSHFLPPDPALLSHSCQAIIALED